MIKTFPEVPAPGILTETWQQISWQGFLQLTKQPEYKSGGFYYHRGYIKIEMTPLGASHGRDNAVVARLISLFATLKNIPIVEFTNTSYRQAEISECQPDSSFYLGEVAKLPPRNNSPIDLSKYDLPTLVVEIAATTLSDDLGQKRLLYEQLGVREYWVVDTNSSDVIAFEIMDGGSREVQVSNVLPGLEISLVETALERSKTVNDGEINRWLIKIFS